MTRLSGLHERDAASRSGRVGETGGADECGEVGILEPAPYHLRPLMMGHVTRNNLILTSMVASATLGCFLLVMVFCAPTISSFVPEWISLRINAVQVNDDLSGEINFHCVVVDQEGRPLEGVVVAVSITQANPSAVVTRGNSWTSAEIECTTGEDGRFAIDGERGISLKVEDLRKEGYLWRVPMRSLDGVRDTGFYCGRYASSYPPAFGQNAASPVTYEMVQLPDPAAKDEAIIDFYGQVMDDGGQPVPGADVALQLGYRRWKTRLDKLTLRTDAEGRFALENMVGQAIFLERIEASGFRPLTAREAKESDQSHEFYYSGRTAKWTFRPDPVAPVIFQLQREP